MQRDLLLRRAAARADDHLGQPAQQHVGIVALRALGRERVVGAADDASGPRSRAPERAEIILGDLVRHDVVVFGRDDEHVAAKFRARAQRAVVREVDAAAAVARQIRSAQSAAFELMRGAGVVAPELAKLERQRERLRYDREESVITGLRDSGKLRPGLNHKKARDIFWMLTGGDVYRMLVSERRWTPGQYEKWLGDTLVQLLMANTK